MDFMHDVLADGTKIRLLTIVDSFSRESLALEVPAGFKSADVVEVLRGLVADRGSPQRIWLVQRSRVRIPATRSVGVPES